MDNTETKKFRRIVVTLVLCVTLGVIASCGICAFMFCSMFEIYEPSRTLIYESVSPEGSYTVRFYRVEAPTVTTIVRAEVTDTETGKTRLIFSSSTKGLSGMLTYDKKLWITWENEEVVVIFEQRLDVRTDSYHY